MNYRQLFELIQRENAMDRAVVFEEDGNYIWLDLKVEPVVDGHGITLVTDHSMDLIHELTCDSEKKNSPYNRPYRQENPQDQALMIASSAEGSLSNLSDFLQNPSVHADRIQRSIAQIEERLNELKDLTKKYIPREW